MEDRNYLVPRQILLKGLQKDLLRLTPSELQCRGSRLKDIGDIGG